MNSGILIRKLLHVKQTIQQNNPKINYCERNDNPNDTILICAVLFCSKQIITFILLQSIFDMNNFTITIHKGYLHFKER